MSKKKCNSKGRPSNELHVSATETLRLRRTATSNRVNVYQTIRGYTAANPTELTYECYDRVALISSVPKFGIWYYVRHLRTRTLGWIAAEAIEYVETVPEASVTNSTDSNDIYVTLSCSKCKFGVGNYAFLVKDLI